MSELIWTKKDQSGQLEVRIYREVTLERKPYNMDFTIYADDPFVVVGGGVQPIDVAANAGALVTASYPNSDLTGWVVSTKEHLIGDWHKVVGYAIAVRIGQLDRNRMRDLIRSWSFTTAPAQYPEASVAVPEGFLLIGGGVNVTYSRAGNLVTASFPESTSSWKVRSREHGIGDQATITAYAIGIKPTIEKPDLPRGFRVMADRGHLRSNDLVPYPEASVRLPRGYVITSGGAEVHLTHPGNLVCKLVPDLDGEDFTFTAASKEHGMGSPASITAHVLGMKLV